jgi:hypothetical protein
MGISIHEKKDVWLGLIPGKPRKLDA